MEPSLVRYSKFLSLVLRHDPQRIGLSLDAHGWATIDELLSQARAHGVPMTREQLEEVVATNEKRRFGLSEDGARIRARQGHSLEVDLLLQPVEPPPVLFHGTASSSVASIRRDGLRPGRRQHVHLSADAATAVEVGRRHGTPVVLVVDAAAMRAAGHEFFRSENGVWLTDLVPPRFLRPIGHAPDHC